MPFDIKFKIKAHDEVTHARGGCLEINVNGCRKRIETPALWFGDLFFSTIKLWEFMKVNTVMFNAYEILSKQNCKRAKSRKKKFNDIINKAIDKFNDIKRKTTVMMDSGGFLLQKNKKMRIRPEKIAKIYSIFRPDIGVVLDYPLDPLSSKEDNAKRWKKTLINTLRMWNSVDVVLLPVVHGYSKSALISACRQLKELLDPQVVLIGLGSLVPIIRYTKGIRELFSSYNNLRRGYNSLHLVAELVRTVREEFPDSFLHVFGVGSVSTMHFLFSLGVDSVDTMGWRLKAAHGAIQLPGVGDRFVTANSKKRVNLSDHDKELLEKCKCPVCKGLSLEEKLQNLDNAIKNGTFKKRAIHNAWVFNWELTMARRMIGKGRYLDYILTNISNRAYKKVIELLFV